jgi:hypothetical protein
MRYARSMWEQRRPMSAIAHSCASCGNELPIGARFCASCGARATAVGRPVTWASAERRYFGVLPDRRTGAVNEELEAVERRANEHIARARIEGGPTNIVPAPEPGPTPPGDPEPPIVPEPEPVPHEPPGPVIVPEPEPVPHEPPGPVIVPEPEPPTGR